MAHSSRRASDGRDLFDTSDSQQQRHMSLTLVCEGCGDVFGPPDARTITIIGLGYAQYRCPDCGYEVRSLPPADPIPAIVPLGTTD
jgi:DNA-directed RNA polymerase subunit RPC12/RpoP